MDDRLTGLDLKTSLLALADIVMPRVCLVCGRVLMAGERHICLSCLSGLPQTRFASCEHNPMADKYNAGMSLDEYEPYAFAAALFYYSADSPYTRINLALKYRRNLAAGRHFSAMLGEELAGSELFSDADLVVPVPLHPGRRWKRGYNQAEVIAKEIARRLNIPCEAGLLRRVRRTRTQTLLTVEQKAANVAGAFALDERLAERNKKVKHILVVDDVFTTGATIRACHAALRKRFPGEVRISAVTLAFVGPD